MNFLIYLAFPSIATSVSWYVGLPWKLVLLCCVLFQLSGPVMKHMRDPYFSDFHTSLNDARGQEQVSNEADGRRTRTEWINMGYWKVRRLFLVFNNLSDPKNRLTLRTLLYSVRHVKVWWFVHISVRTAHSVRLNSSCPKAHRSSEMSARGYCTWYACVLHPMQPHLTDICIL